MVHEARKPIKKVRLEANGYSQEFEISHAERILDMGQAINGGWHVPANSEYEYSEEYGLTLKPNKGSNTKEA